MEYIRLKEQLKKQNFTSVIYGNQTLNCDLMSVRLLTDGLEKYDPSILYLASTSQLPLPDCAGKFTVFCYGDPIDFSAYDASEFNLTYFGTDVSPAELFNFVMDCLSELQQVTIGMHLLVNALFSGKGLQYLIDSATDLFGNPIYVVDLQHKYLAISAGILPSNELFKEEHSAGYIGEAGLQFIQQNQINQKVRKSRTAYYCVNTLVDTGMLIDSIRIQGIEVGHIMMMESQHQFRPYDADFFHRFSKLVAVELQKDSAYSQNKGVMYSYFLGDLIRHPDQKVQDVEKRLKSMGYPLKETFYIIAIPPAGHTTSDLKLEVILEGLKQIFPEGIYVIYEDTIVFLISRELEQRLSEYEVSRLEEYLSANNLKAGISNFYQYLKDTSRFYQQAIDSVHLGLKLEDPAPIYYYSDYYLYQMLEIFEKTDKEIRFLIHPGLMRLYLYDQEHGTDLIHTLIEYLKRPGHPAEITEILHIHKNTLLYRMGKIKSITHCEFVEGDDFMHFDMSIKIMKYLKMLKL